MNILDRSSEDKIMPFFRLAFRPFFLTGAVFSIAALLIWGMFLSGYATFAFSGNPIWWHSHEMLFGFAGAIIVGFLLTAVQNWTGIPGVRSWKLAGLFSLWLLARVMLLVSKEPQLWIIALDLLWMPMAAYFLGKPVWLKKGWKNLPFVPILLLMTLVNGLMHYGNITNQFQLSMNAAWLMILLIVELMLILGGRVIPFFTAVKLNFKQAERYLWLELGSLTPVWLVFFISLFNIPGTELIVDGLLFAAFVFNLIRFLRWKPLLTLKTPLLWSLHISWLMIILGLLVMSLSRMLQLNDVMAIHLITIGGMGGLILAMIARVSLGHTGRILELPGKLMAVALAFPAISAILRGLFPELLPAYTFDWYLLSILAWVIAYGVYVVYYIPVLLKPRVDGMPG